MKKFTIIADYNGGFFVSQYYADSVDDAIMEWAGNLDLQYFSKKEKKKILEELKEQAIEDPATALSGLSNVWYQGIRVYKKFVHMHIVETVS